MLALFICVYIYICMFIFVVFIALNKAVFHTLSLFIVYLRKKDKQALKYIFSMQKYLGQ